MLQGWANMNTYECKERRENCVMGYSYNKSEQDAQFIDKVL